LLVYISLIGFVNTKTIQGLLKTSRKKQPEKPPESALGGGLSGDWSAVKALLLERKEQGLSDRVQTQTEIINGGLVLRSLFSLAMGNIYATYRAQVLVLNESIGPFIGSILGVPENENHKIRKIMSDTAYDMMGEQKEGMAAFIETIRGE
jgi:hypothetical protein